MTLERFRYNQPPLKADGTPAPPPGARLMLWPGRGLYVGPLLANELHSHHAVQVTVALSGQLNVSDSSAGRKRRVSTLITTGDAPHRISGHCTTAQLYLDPESSEGRRIAATYARTDHVSATTTRPVADLFRDLRAASATPDQWNSAVQQLCALLTQGPHHPLPLDPRVTSVQALAHESIGRPLGLTKAAASVGLSPSRLSHLYVEQTGLPFRRYRLWLRLIRSIELIAAAETLTTAAHAAGFADSAHLTRTFRRMFGMAPSALLVQHVAIDIDTHGWLPPGRQR